MRATLILFVLLACLRAQQPPITNARLESRPVQGNLEATLRSLPPGPAWVGYAAPSIRGDHQMCCWSDSSRGCGLERNGPMSSGTAARPTLPVPLEGATTFAVLLRVERQAVTKVRAFSLDCALDAGGLPFVWLTGVAPADSVSLLSGLALREEEGMKGAVHALAMHGDPAADRALERLTAPTSPARVRRDVAFWLGSSRGRPGVDTLARMLRDDPDDAVRKHLTFALSVSKDPEALRLLVDAAKSDRSPSVRSQALFWMAQKAGQRATSAITDAVENDPDTDVKKKAVFALSQMPNGEGVPRLIEVARANRNPEVRKQAMFWLGQSRDPRAAQFLEQVLLGR